MTPRYRVRSTVRVLGATAAVYGLCTLLRRSAERTANRGLARGKRFLILGGGFAGAAVAQELARLLPAGANGSITLLDQNNYLLFTPMLTEAAGGELSTRDIVSPARSLRRHVRFVQGTVTDIDIERRSVRFSVGGCALDHEDRTLTCDELVIALGSVVNFHQTPGVEENSISMKQLQDATRAFEHVSACLERASIETDVQERLRLLTFVVGGGGYTGVETMAAINDLVRSAAVEFPDLDAREVRTVLVHPGDRLLPEVDAHLAAYATEKLKQRGVEVRLKTEVASAGPDFVGLKGKEQIGARTLIWAAGVTPHPLIWKLPAAKGKHHGLVVDECMQVKGYDGVWALGDCAEIPEPNGGGTYAPTAQNATREGKLLAKNLVRRLRRQPLEAFRYTPIGELALVGRRSGVARVYGRNFSGLLAWAMWRAIYLAKMPSFAQQGRILAGWMLDAVLGRAAVPLSSGDAPRRVS